MSGDPKAIDPLLTMSKSAMEGALRQLMPQMAEMEAQTFELMHLLTLVSLLGGTVSRDAEGRPERINLQISKEVFDSVASTRWRMEKRADSEQQLLELTFVRESTTPE